MMQTPHHRLYKGAFTCVGMQQLREAWGSSQCHDVASALSHVHALMWLLDLLNVPCCSACHTQSNCTSHKSVHGQCTAPMPCVLVTPALPCHAMPHARYIPVQTVYCLHLVSCT